MPNGLRSKLSKLRFQGKITQEEYKELIEKLEGHDESIIAQIMWERDTAIEQLKQLGYGLGAKIEPCEDCISRKAALDELDKYIDKAQNTGTRDDFISFQELVVKQLPSVKPQTVTDFTDKCKECGKILNEKNQQKWIPTSEKLPEDYIHVLCQFALGGMGECYLANGLFHIIGGVRMSCDEVIAWMPLPQPYKAESE